MIKKLVLIVLVFFVSKNLYGQKVEEIVITPTIWLFCCDSIVEQPAVVIVNKDLGIQVTSTWYPAYFISAEAFRKVDSIFSTNKAIEVPINIIPRDSDYLFLFYNQGCFRICSIADTVIKYEYATPSEEKSKDYFNGIKNVLTSDSASTEVIQGLNTLLDRMEVLDEQSAW